MITNMTTTNHPHIDAATATDTIVHYLSPHGVCWLWDWRLILLHAPFDLMTFAAYMIIPLTALRIFRLGHLRDVAVMYPGLWTLGGLFVTFCGLSHLGSFLEIWIGGRLYWLTGINKVLMGCVSLAFAYVFYTLQERIILIAKTIREIREHEHGATDTNPN